MQADLMQPDTHLAAPDTHLAAPGGEGAAEPDRLADGVSTVWAAEQVSDSELQLIKARTMYQVWIWREGSLAHSGEKGPSLVLCCSGRVVWAAASRCGGKRFERQCGGVRCRWSRKSTTPAAAVGVASFS